MPRCLRLSFNDSSLTKFNSDKQYYEKPFKRKYFKTVHIHLFVYYLAGIKLSALRCPSGVVQCNNNFSNFCYNTVVHVHQCVLALYAQYFPECCEKITGILFEWDSNSDLCNSRAVSYELNHRDYPVAT